MFFRTAAFRRLVIVAVQFGITAAAVAFLLRRVDLASTRDSFASADLALLPVALAFLLGDLLLRAVRWRLLFAPRKDFSFANLFGAANVGYLVNDILPLRAGEVARVLVIDQVENTGKIRAAASIAVERAIDVVAMTLLVVALLPFVDAPSWARGPAILLGAAVLGGLMAAVAFARVNDAGWRGWRAPLARMPKVGARLLSLADELLLGMEPLLRVSVLSRVVLMTGVIWCCAALSFFFMMRAFGIHHGLTAAAFVLSATTLGMVVPSSPGYVGVFHAIAVSTLTNVFGVPRAEALSYAVAQHALIVVTPSVLGIAFLLTRRDLVPGLLSSVFRSGSGADSERLKRGVPEPALGTTDAA